MQKRIKRSIMLVTLISVILVTALLAFLFYEILKKQVISSLWDRAQIMREILDKEENETALLSSLNLASTTVRYTLVDPKGIVLFDSNVKPELLENHAERIEFQQALKTGKGSSKRYSNTINLESHYVAYKLSSGSVLRLSQSSRSIYGVFLSTLPSIIIATVIVLFFGTILTKRLTNNIIKPINDVDLMSDDIILYDELSTFIRTLIKDRKRIESQSDDIKRKSDMINTIIGSIKEGMILLDKEGTIITANKSALTLFHVTSDVVGKSILEFTRSKEFYEHTLKALSGENSEMIDTKNHKCYHLFFSPATEGGVIILLLDITEKANIEKMRREFTANVSHELKTPLTNILGYAEMIHDGIAKPKDIVTFSGKINEEASRLRLLVDDILLLSQLDEENKSLDKESLDLSFTAKQVMEALTHKAKENNISLLLEGEDIVAKVNASMIYELLFNLVENGIKYNKPNGSVTILLFSEKESSTILVKDTGIGIPLEHQSRIFERFYRVDKSRSKKTGGTGLGLSIAKHIVQIHNGTIFLESQLDVGTTVIITLP